jgi:hypothetical protein
MKVNDRFGMEVAILQGENQEEKFLVWQVASKIKM